jgi:MtN3 and saliva related transmembrane protein
MDITTLIGSMAAFCTTVSFLPQVIKIYRMRETRDISLLMYVIFSIGIFLWLCYGVMISSMPIIIANSITITLSLYILAMKVKYR